MTTETAKRCVTCSQTLPLASFSRNRSRPDGLQQRCKGCVASHYQRNRESIIARVQQYKDENCDDVLARRRQYRLRYPERVAEQSRIAYRKRADYYKARASAYYAENRERQLANAKAWQELHRAEVRLVKAKHKHRRRQLERANGIFVVTRRDTDRMLMRAASCCTYCLTPFTDSIPATWDHIIPVVRGGRFSVGNLVPACGSCNSSKGSKTLMEWRISRIVFRAA